MMNIFNLKISLVKREHIPKNLIKKIPSQKKTYQNFFKIRKKNQKKIKNNVIL